MTSERDADPACAAWFLCPDERGNTATSIDEASDGTAWTSGNSVCLHHGRAYYRALRCELDKASTDDLVLFTDWRGDPDEELGGSPVVDVLRCAAERGVRIKGLIWRSHPDKTRFSEQENRDLAAEVNDVGGEVLLDERVRRAGSHHQKMFVVVHPHAAAKDVAFVGGIDLCHGRNDDPSHHGDLQPVQMDSRFGPTPAWHDLQAEIRGPAVAAIAETFRERWNDPHPLRMRGIPLRRADPAPPCEQLGSLRHVGDSTPAPGSQAVQVLRTYPVRRPKYPFAPEGERSIARAYLKAFRRARRLIYVEDQYLWSSCAAEALGQAAREQPGLKIVAVVPRYPDEDGRLSGPPNRIGQIRAIRHLQEVAGSRFALYDLETQHYPIYVHAKVCIVDDVWMTIGSDNLNRRSWTHDSELSCAVIDARHDNREPIDPAGLGDGARVFARETRLSLWGEHLQRDDVPVDPDEGFELLRASADQLDGWHASGRRAPRPAGRLRHHIPEPVPPSRRLVSKAMYRLVNDPDGRPISLRLRRSY